MSVLMANPADKLGKEGCYEQKKESIHGSRQPVDILLPRCYQKTPYQDDPGRHPTGPDRFNLVSLGLLGYPEYMARGNS